MVKIDAQSRRCRQEKEVQTWFELLYEAYGRFITFDSASTSPVFMRVMAYVETRDGATADPNGGGIWNVTVEDALFRRTQHDHRLNDIIMQLETANDSYLTPIYWRSLNYCNQWRIQDFLKGVSVILLRAKRAQNFRSHAHF